jgi:hypothetical protein
MDCAMCRELKRVFEIKMTKYVEACASAYYRVSTQVAARRNVDMERAKNDWEEHQMVCEWVLHGRDMSGPSVQCTTLKTKEPVVERFERYRPDLRPGILQLVTLQTCSDRR